MPTTHLLLHLNQMSNLHVLVELWHNPLDAVPKHLVIMVQMVIMMRVRMVVMTIVAVSGAPTVIVVRGPLHPEITVLLGDGSCSGFFVKGDAVVLLLSCYQSFSKL